MRVFLAGLRFAAAASIFCLLPLAAAAPAQAYWTTEMAISSASHHAIRAAHGQRREGGARHREFRLPEPPPVARTVRSIRRHAVRLIHALTPQCRVAASLGGPCGCFAGELLGLPRIYRGHNLWLAQEWANAFPRTAPAPGTAAVWPHRHVALVVAVNGDGTVTVHDSWAVHRVSARGLVFVQPPTAPHRI